VQWGLVWVCQ